MKAKPKFKVGERVFDSWWEYRGGEVIKVNKNTMMVRWDMGSTSVYDRAHQRFLRKEELAQ